MKIRENPDLNEVYHFFKDVYPKPKTDRISDLERLSSTESHFVIYSPARNGTTTLMKHLARIKDGLYIDSQGLRPEDVENELTTRIKESGKHLVLIDELTSLFWRFDGYQACLDFLEGFLEDYQLGLRLHSDQPEGQDLERRGFEIVEVGKIPYAEFREIVDPKFKEINFPFPEELIGQAHSTYDALAKSLYYVAEACRLMVENPDEKLTDKRIKQELLMKYYLFKNK